MKNHHHSSAQGEISRRWLDMLEENQVCLVVLDPQQDSKLIEQLQTHPGWIVDFVSPEAIFFVRERFGNQHQSLVQNTPTELCAG